MRFFTFYILVSCLFPLSLAAQQNNSLSGKVLFLNSDNTPAIGVELSGSIKLTDSTTINANIVYSKNDGSYTLVFPKAVVGSVVRLSVGDTDSKGQAIEVINEEELRICRIPEDPTEAFEIIVCKKGQRDFVAKRYYNILKTAADYELDRMKKQWSVLVEESKKDYQKISDLSERITQLEKQADSLQLYKDALRIASINKDNATKRVKRYLKLLDEGISIQEARKVLSVNKAIDELEVGTLKFNAAVTELQTRATASKNMFDYKDAIRCYDILIYYAEKMGVDRLKVAIYYAEIAFVISDNGNYEKALEYERKIMNIFEEILDSKHLDLAAPYNNIGVTYQSLGEYATALKYHQKAISIWEVVLNPKHPSLAAAYNNIGRTYRFLGQYKTALKYHLKAISIQEVVLNPKHPDLATVYNNIGGTYEALGQYKTALNYQREAISIQEAVLAPKHPDLATSYNNIGLTYQSLGQYKNALKYQSKAISIQEEVLDSKNPDLAWFYNNIGGTYQYLGQYKNALKYHLKAINIQEETLDFKHPNLGISYMNIAVTYSKVKEFKKAISFQKKCLAIFKEVLPENHPIQDKALHELADIYGSKASNHYNNKEYIQAIESFQKAVKISSKTRKKHFHYNNLGLAYAKNKQFREANDAFMAYEKCCPDKGITYRNWAMYYALQNDKEKALSNLQKAVALGYKDMEWLKTDDSIDSLRNEKVFIEIIKKLEKEKRK